MSGYLNTGLIALLAQLANPGVDTPEEAALIFSGPQFFIALLSGLVLAFGFQLLLTNLSVAAGISVVGRTAKPSKSGSDSSGFGKISIAVGAWTLITVSLALFFACWLAVKLSLYNSILLGSITGLVIWGTYFSLLFWVSSTTVGSLIGSVVRTATASFNSLVGTATAAFGARAASNQVVETAEAIATTVRREMSQVLDDDDLLDSFKDYVATLQSPELDTQGLEAEFERLIEDSGLATAADYETLSQLDRSAFEHLVSQRTDLSRQEIKRVSNQLYRTWQQSLARAANQHSLTELVDYVQTASSGEQIAEHLGERLDRFVSEYRQKRQSESSGWLSQGFNALIGIVLGRVDLSDFDVEKIVGQVEQAKSQLVEQGDKVSQQLESRETPYNPVKTDVESYLLNTYPWQLQPARLKTEFRARLYDSEADPGLLRRSIAPLSQAYFSELLTARGLMTQTEIERTAALLESVRSEVLREVTDLDRFEKAQALQHQIHTYLQATPRDELLSNASDRAFLSRLEDADASYADLQARFSALDREQLTLALRARGDLSEAEIQQLAAQFDRLTNQALADANGLQAATKTRLENQWQQLQDYLRHTGKAELNPEGIKADVKTLMQEPDAGIERLRQRLAQFDRETLIQLLNQRHDLDEAEIRRVAGNVETTWYQTINAPPALTAKAKAQYDEATQALANYLRSTGKPELNPEGIKRDLKTLLDDPQAGMQAMRDRLAQADRDTLVQLLSQRDDLSEAEVNQIIDDLLEAIRSLLRAPQRVARRAQQEVLSFEQSVADYLRSTDKAELNPEGIKRDFQLLVNDPRLGSQRLQDRLSSMDRSTLVALLAQRPDITQAEAESAVGQLFAVRDQILAQVRSLQARLQAMIQRLLSRVRAYLDSLDRPELAYAGIRRDLQQLFNDPQAGFEAWQQRFSRFDRDTLVAILSSHDAISETDATQVIGQVEVTRDRVLRQAERLEQKVESRVYALKQQAYQQVEDTRKAAAAAAWWIFATATISAIASAIAGGLAVIG